jgi:hypothetical protein
MNPEDIRHLLSRCCFRWGTMPLSDIREPFRLMDDSFIEGETGNPVLSRFLSAYPTVLGNSAPRFKLMTLIASFFHSKAYSRVPPDDAAVKLNFLIRKGFGNSLREEIARENLPLLHTNPLTAMIAESAGHSLSYCLIPGADAPRIWAPASAGRSRLCYFVTCARVVGQLKSYGIPDERIFFTGLPYPRRVLGSEALETLKQDLGQRLHYLDPKERFWPVHGRNVKFFITEEYAHFRKERTLTLSFIIRSSDMSVQTALSAIRSLAGRLSSGQLRVVVAAGDDHAAAERFREGCRNSGLCAEGMPMGTVLLFDPDFAVFFERFSDLLRETDILWAPSNELAFAGGLGIPWILMPARTSQETENRNWLIETQLGFPQEDPEFTDEWLTSLRENGDLAEAAWGGFLKERKFGLYKIEEILRTGTMIRESSPLRR